MPPGPGLWWGGGGVQEELVVLQRVDGTGDVAHEGLGLSGRHGPGEAAALQEEGRKGEEGGRPCCERVGWRELQQSNASTPQPDPSSFALDE